MLTTSYPLTPDSVSGIFIRHLIDHLPPHVITTVITPCATRPPQDPHLRCCRYAPWSWQTLAHGPGGLPVAFKGHPWRLLLLPPFLLTLLWAVIRAARHADLIQANWSIPGVLAGLAGRLTGKPVVTTLRGSDIHRAHDSFVHRLLLSLCLKLNQAVVTVSAEFHALLTGWYPQQAHKIHLIPNGIDTVRFAPSPDPPATPRLITIGNLTPHKGVHHLLSALAGLQQVYPFELLVVGDGPEKESLIAQAHALGLTQRVHFSGAVPPDRIPGLLTRSTLYLTASAGEGRSNAVLEAMASGLPVIAGRVSGMAELIEHERTGLLYDPDRSDALASAIARVLAEPDRARRMGLEARNRLIAQGLEWSATARRYHALWSSLLCAV
ncbi:MAG: glycosyltransferase family 4 protein [Magnetococcales bacterium]|nr:glycosyltransferase family 4 protein [Magnetococcales bacterium]